MASRICFIPNCSPVAEIRRTSRARIWPLILGSSSVATVHHSSQKTRFRGRSSVSNENLLVRRTDADPQLPIRLYSAPAACVYTDLLARAHLAEDPRRELLQRRFLLLLLAAAAHVDRPALGLR